MEGPATKKKLSSIYEITYGRISIYRIRGRSPLEIGASSNCKRYNKRGRIPFNSKKLEAKEGRKRSVIENDCTRSIDRKCGRPKNKLSGQEEILSLRPH